MNSIITNSLIGYFKTLYILNQNLIKLCGVDAIDHSQVMSECIYDIIQDIPRLIPYVYSDRVRGLELGEKDGLLEFSDEILHFKLLY